MEKIHLQIHLYLGNQKAQSAENGIKWLLGQYFTIHTFIDKVFEYRFHEYINKILRNWGKMQNKIRR